jgi:N,N'-diacetylchitobiose phosphorylase
LAKDGLAAKDRKDLISQGERFEKSAEMLKGNILKAAMNEEGYLNGVFNDAGNWLFSPKDPDGAHRINSTPNTFAVIAGVVQGEQREKVFKAMEALKGPHGWRLFYPPIGHPPIAKLGRIGQGDLAPGLFENGAPYNHGSHGFLARAAFVAGKGDLFYEVTKYFLPYDQTAHPVGVTKTLPFAIVNSYSEAEGQEGRGGAPYHTGSIPVAARNVYDGFLGFRPNLHHLVIDPVIPAAWDSSGGYTRLFGGRFNVTIRNPKHVQCGVKSLTMDGKEVGERYFDKLAGRDVVGIPIAALKKGENHEIVVTLG